MNQRSPSSSKSQKNTVNNKHFTNHNTFDYFHRSVLRSPNSLRQNTMKDLDLDEDRQMVTDEVLEEGMAKIEMFNAHLND